MQEYLYTVFLYALAATLISMSFISGLVVGSKITTFLYFKNKENRNG